MKSMMLFVTNLHFSKDGNGGQQRTYYLIKELSKHFALTVISPYNKEESIVQDINADFLVNQGIAHIKKFRENKILRLGFKLLNIVMTKCLTTNRNSLLPRSASFLLSKQLNNIKKQSKYKNLNTIVFDILPTVVHIKDNLYANRILNAHNFDFELASMNYAKAKDDTSVSKERLLLIEERLALLKTFEYNIDNFFDEIWVCSDEDAEKFKVANPKTKVRFYTLPNGSDTCERKFQTFNKEYQKFLFVGSLNYFPNYNGLQWFIEHVFKFLPNNYQLNIVGKSPDGSDFTYLEQYPNVNLIGEVDSVAPYYEAHDVFVVPLLEGSGTRLKILEAMSYGKLVLSTKKGIEGINAVSGIHYFEFNTREEFEALFSVLENEGKMLEIRKNARQLIEEHYSWSGIVNNYVKQKNGK